MPAKNPYRFLPKKLVNFLYDIFSILMKYGFPFYYQHVATKLPKPTEVKEIGELISINTNSGGLPKIPRDSDFVTPWGLTTDRQMCKWIEIWGGHGGPRRAVSIWSTEVQDLLNREGASTYPGSCGENLTFKGVDWNSVDTNNVYMVGDVVFQITESAHPCKKQIPYFKDGDYSPISIHKYDGVTRWYGKVLRPGRVNKGDKVYEVLKHDLPMELEKPRRVRRKERTRQKLATMATEEAGPIRAAFDLGSGATKLTIGSVQSNGTLKILFSEQVGVLVGAALKASVDNRIPESTESELYAALSRYKEISVNHNATQFLCVCTAAFRLANNGLELIENLSKQFEFPFRVIAQQLEGELGFQTAVAVSQTNREQEENIISWDSGGASFQIVGKSNGKTLVLEGPIGTSNCANLLITKIQKREYLSKPTTNPATMEQTKILIDMLINDIIPPCPEWLREKIKSENVKVVGIGGDTCLFRYIYLMKDKYYFTEEDIPELIEFCSDKTDEELSHLPRAGFMIPKLALMTAVFRKYGFKEVCYCPSNGNTEGMILEENLWT